MSFHLEAEGVAEYMSSRLTARFTPDPAPENAEELPGYLANSLSQVGAMVNSPTRNFAPLNSAPPKPTDGDVAFADGIGWDPGSGRGMYSYDGEEWVLIGGGGGGGGVPIGGIIIWTGSSIPDGWALCDGNNAPNGVSTPDLQDRFIKGAGSVAVGTSGGSTNTGSTSLSTSQMPSHTHGGPSHTHTQRGSFNTSESGTHGHGNAVLNRGAQTYSTRGDGTIVYMHDPNNPSAIAQGGNHGHAVTISGETGHTAGTTGGAGSGNSHNHSLDPVYYAVAYIMRYE
jgi:microcystin-dependent protein